jgi:hypothetical protein
MLQICEDMDKCPDYIIDYFKDIIEKIDEGENYDFVNDSNEFTGKLTKKLERYITNYLK